MKIKLLQKTLLWTVLFTACLTSLFSCSGCNKKQSSNEQPSCVYMVPDDAAVVIHFNVKNIWEKADLDHIDQFAFFKYFLQEVRDEKPDDAEFINKLLENPDAYGFNLKGDFFMFWFMSATTEKDLDLFFGYTINDADQYKKLLEERYGDTDIVFRKKKNYSLAYSQKRKYAYCWNDSKVYNFDAETEQDANEYAQKLMSLQESNSLTQNAGFKTFLQNDNDLGVFVNNDKNQNSDFIVAGVDFSQLFNLEQVEHSSLGLSFIFENGGIRIPIAIFSLENNQSDSFFTDNFNNGIISYLPQQTLATASFALDMNTLVNWIEKNNEGQFNLDEEVSGGYSARDIIKCLTGNFAASLSDLRLNSNGSPEFTFAVVAELNNSDPIRQTLEADEKDGLKRDGDSYLMESDELGNMSISINDNTLMLTNEPSVRKAFSKGGNNNNVEMFASKMQNGLYLHLNLDVNNYPSSLFDQYDQDIVKLAGGYFKEAEFRMTGPTSAEFFISLQDSDKNSLDYTLRYIDDNLVTLKRLTQ